MNDGLLYLVAEGTHQILHRFSVIFAEFAKIIEEDLVEPALPVRANDIVGTCFQCNKPSFRRISLHYFEPVGGILQEA